MKRRLLNVVVVSVLSVPLLTVAIGGLMHIFPSHETIIDVPGLGDEPRSPVRVAIGLTIGMLVLLVPFGAVVTSYVRKGF